MAEGAAGAALDAVRNLSLGGLSVTMPHKDAVAALVDELEPTAELLGSVNCVVPRDGRLVGANTDGEGFLAGIEHDLGVVPRGRRCVVLGAGGAARAVVVALAGAGAESVAVWNRSLDRAGVAASLAGGVGEVVEGRDLPGVVGAADLVVNATPLGMGDDQRLPLDEGLLAPGTAVVDLVYHPRTTPLLEAAAARGCATANGLGMLVGQAACAFERWTSVAAPRAAMYDAVGR